MTYRELVDSALELAKENPEYIYPSDYGMCSYVFNYPDGKRETGGCLWGRALQKCGLAHNALLQYEDMSIDSIFKSSEIKFHICSIQEAQDNEEPWGDLIEDLEKLYDHDEIDDEIKFA